MERLQSAYRATWFLRRSWTMYVPVLPEVRADLRYSGGIFSSCFLFWQQIRSKWCSYTTRRTSHSEQFKEKLLMTAYLMTAYLQPLSKVTDSIIIGWLLYLNNRAQWAAAFLRSSVQRLTASAVITCCDYDFKNKNHSFSCYAAKCARISLKEQ